MKLTNEQLAMVDTRVELPDGNFVVLLDVAGRNDMVVQEHSENVFCVRQDNEVIWKVSPSVSPHGKDSFVSIELTKEGIRADRFFGGEFLIDISTGVAREVGWHK